MADGKKEGALGSSTMAANSEQDRTGKPAGQRGLPEFESPAQRDSWFDAQLMQIYTEVVSEPLPKEFLDLLDKLREKKRDTSK